MTGENHNRKFFNSERCYCSSPLAHSCWIIFFFLLFFWLHKSVKSPCRHQGFDLKTSWQVRFNYASFCMSSIPRNEIITQLGFTSTELMLVQYTAHRPLMSLYLLPYLSRSIFPHNCLLKWHRAMQ